MPAHVPPILVTLFVAATFLVAQTVHSAPSPQVNLLGSDWLKHYEQGSTRAHSDFDHADGSLFEAFLDKSNPLNLAFAPGAATSPKKRLMTRRVKCNELAARS